MPPDPAWLLAPVAVLLIAGLKGAFGGGFAILGIPLLALTMDPVEAGAMLAPLFLAMDVAAFRYWKPGTWSTPDLAVLIPGMAAGVAIGTLLVAVLPRQAVTLGIAAVTLGFALAWFLGGGRVRARPRVRWRGVLAGAGSGVTTMLAHAGGPPVAMYLLPLGLPKAVYAGTTSIYFTAANLLKVGPWLLAAPPSAATWALMAACLPACWLGVWIGWRLHQRLDQQRLYRWCYGLLVATGLKLLWDGISL